MDDGGRSTAHAHTYLEAIVALQGTIETFALTDVLRLLSSTKKTGCLHLTGGRGNGSIWVDGGQIVASEVSSAPRADGSTEVVFELLRFKEGEFVFEADVEAPSKGSGEDVEPVLEQAEAMLEEWKSIEAVVPSLDSWLSLAPELPDDEVSIDRDRWKLVSLVGGGTTVGALADALELGELGVSRQAKELVESGLVAIGDAPAGASTPTVASVAAPASDDGPVLTLAPEDDDEAIDAGAIDVEVIDVEVVSETFGDSEFEPFDLAGLVVEETDLVTDAGSEGPAAVDEAPTVAPTPPPEPTDAAEIARQLANLSPKAAKAVAAAAKATTQEERERALAEVDDSEDPINRDLLIKFLGSVNS